MPEQRGLLGAGAGGSGVGGGVGIQLFATITSKEHYTSLQRDLGSLAGQPALQDTMLYCSDGTLHLSRQARYLWISLYIQ